LWNFGVELFVELFKGGFGGGGFGFETRQFVGIFVGLVDQLADFGAEGIVVEEFVVALLDAWEIVLVLVISSTVVVTN